MISIKFIYLKVCSIINQVQAIDISVLCDQLPAERTLEILTSFGYKRTDFSSDIDTEVSNALGYIQGSSATPYGRVCKNDNVVLSESTYLDIKQNDKCHYIFLDVDEDYCVITFC